MARILAPVRARPTEYSRRKVTWLELFFDLIFAAAIAQVAEPLRHEYSLAALVRLTPLLALIWWAWTGHTFFSTRFDIDDGMQRGMTFLQIFAVAVMAANAKEALDSRSSAGFAAAYAAVRLVLVAQYLRARHVTHARGLTRRYIAGHGTAAALWLSSALVSVPARFWVWTVAFSIDLGTPWFAVSHSIKAPPDAAHVPERFGLFTLILLGESVVAVMLGIESHDDWPAQAALSAVLGMGVPFLICWWYFDRAADSEQRVRTRRDAIRFHVWSYAHFPLCLGIVVLGVGIQRVVAAAAHSAVSQPERLILMGAAATVAIAMTTITLATESPDVGAVRSARRTA
jgi:low temperature requirement protein LtrA